MSGVGSGKIAECVTVSGKTAEEEKKIHFPPEDLSKAQIHRNDLFSLFKFAHDNPNANAAAFDQSEHPFTLVVLGVPQALATIKNKQEMEWSQHSKKGMEMVENPFNTILKPLWIKACVRVCCDNSYSLLYSNLSSDERQRFLPHMLVGAIDELDSEVTQFISQYSQGKEAKVVDISWKSSDCTDLYKALYLLNLGRKHWRNKRNTDTVEHQTPSHHPSGDKVPTASSGCESINSDELHKLCCSSLCNDKLPHGTVLVYCDDTIHRMDKALSNVNTCIQFLNDFDRVVVIHSSGHCFEMLRSGYHQIWPNKEIESLRSSCGLIPILKPCQTVWSQGLQWPLEGCRLEFGNKLSCMNTIIAERVLIYNSDPILWTNTFTWDQTQETHKHKCAQTGEKAEILQKQKNSASAATLEPGLTAQLAAPSQQATTAEPNDFSHRSHH